MPRHFKFFLRLTLVFCAVQLPASVSAQALTWTGAAGDGLASTAGNWDANRVPTAADSIFIDGNVGQSDLVWDSAATHAMAAWSQNAAYTGTVTIMTVYHAQAPSYGNFTTLAISGDCVINGGVMTHAGNPNAVRTIENERYRLCINVGGNLTIGPSGAIDVKGKGYNAARSGGPGAGWGAAHGGLADRTGGYCYGSITAPTNLGSSGSSHPGGGAVMLHVHGVVQLDAGAVISAEGAGTGYYVGAGGSVYLHCGDLTGAGTITVNATQQSLAHSASGGGRISLVVTNAGADFSSFTGAITAYGQRGAGAGTIYLERQSELPGRGTIILDNNNNPGLTTDFNPPPAMADMTVASLHIRNAAAVGVAENHFLRISGVWSNSSGSMAFTNNSGVRFTDEFTAMSRIYGSTVFSGLVCTNDFPSGKTIVFEAGSTTSIAEDGLLLLDGSESLTNVYLRSSAPGSAWYLNMHGDAVQSVYYVDVQDSDARVGPAEVTAFFSRDSGRNYGWAFSDFPPGTRNEWIAGTGDWATGSNWSLGRAPVQEDSVAIPSGTVNMGAAQTVHGLEIGASGVLALNGYNLTLTDHASLAGTLIASTNETITFYADADFTGGSFTKAVSIVEFSGTASQMFNPAGLVFHRVRIAKTSGVLTFGDGFAAYELLSQPGVADAHNLYFAPDKDVDLDFLTLLGAPLTTNIVLRNAGGSRWRLNVSVSHSVRGVDVGSSQSTGMTIEPSNSRDAGNNYGWVFNPNIYDWTGLANTAFDNPGNWWPSSVPGQTEHVRVLADRALVIDSDTTLASITVGGGTPDGNTPEPLVTVNAPLTIAEDVFVFQNGELNINRQSHIGRDVRVFAGGLLSHTANGSEEIHKLDLTVNSDFIVDAGGAVDVRGRGYRFRQGPGGGYGASYGGVGGWPSAGYPAPCYGSISAPTNLGSGGHNEDGGGAVILNVSGNLRNYGVIGADGLPATYAGSGGSVFITTGGMTGTGVIRANGGAGGSSSAGGGGRVALVLTGENACFDDYSGTIEAFGGGSVGAGTIFLKNQGELSTRPLVLVKNNNEPNTRRTEVPPALNNYPEEVKHAAFRVSNGAIMGLTNDYMVGDIWLDTTNSMLDLGGHILFVNSLPHKLGSGSVVNYGEIRWLEGALIQFW